MRFRELGASGLRVSEVGFGCWGIGGASYGATDDAESSRAILFAVDRGVNFFDTSDFYGFGKSEEILGTAFLGLRDRVLIASKAGWLNERGDQDFSASHIRKSLEGSLKRLRTDSIDLYQLHSPRIGDAAVPEAIETLLALKREGKIRAYGVSARSPQDAMYFIEKHQIPVVQVNFNLIDQRAEDCGLFQLAEKTGTGIIGRTPLCFGFLTGQYGTARFGEKDHRSQWAPEQREIWSQAIEKFMPVLDPGQCQARSQAAMRFCLSYSAISTIIPGILTREQALENSAASDLGPFPGEMIERVRAIYKENVFFVRP